VAASAVRFAGSSVRGSGRGHLQTICAAHILCRRAPSSPSSCSPRAC